MGKEIITEIQRLEKKVANDPASRAFIQLADKYLEQNRMDEAIDVLSAGIACHPTYVAARMMLGKVYLQAKRIKDAKTEFEYVIQIHPENVLAYKKLAVIYRALNKLGEAIKICNTILAIDPYDKETKTLLVSVHDEISAMDDIHSLPPETASDQLAPSSAQESPAAQSDQEAAISAGFSTHMETPLEEPFSSKRESQRVEQAILAGYHTEYPRETTPPPLNLIRLKAWLGSIQEKGERR